MTPLSEKDLALGLVADTVFEVTPFRRDSIEPAPDIGVRWGVRWRSDYISGVVRRATGFVVIIDLAHLLGLKERGRFFCQRATG